jgi:hypothetical protein
MGNAGLDSFSVAEVLASDFHPPLGEPSEVIEGSMTARIAATIYDLDRLQEAAETRMAEAVGAELAIVPGSVRVDLLPVGTPGEATYQARVRARSRPDFGDWPQDRRQVDDRGGGHP